MLLALPIRGGVRSAQRVEPRPPVTTPSSHLRERTGSRESRFRARLGLVLIRLRSLGLLGLALSLGCDSTQDPPGTPNVPAPASAHPAPKETPAPTPAAEQPAARPKPKLPTNTFELPTQEEVAKTKTSLKSHLGAGRKAVKNKDYKAGIASLREAKKLNPASPKVLGELGWALFLDGQTEAAETELRAALRRPSPNNTKGALLYNLGRVEVERGNEEIAAEYFRQSLERRPNATVRTQLEALGPSAERSHAACTFSKQPEPTPPNLCQRYIQDMPPSAFGDEVECSFQSIRERKLPAGHAVAAGEITTESLMMLEGEGYEATVFSFTDRDLYSEQFVLVVSVGTQWWTVAIEEVGHPGVGYADENLNEITLEAIELTGAGKPEIVVRWDASGHDMDPGVEYMHDYAWSSLAVVTVDSGVPQWLATVSTSSEASEGDMNPDEWGAMVNPVERRFKAAVTFPEPGSLRVSDAGKLAAPPSSATGTFKLGSYPVLCPAEQDAYGAG